MTAPQRGDWSRLHNEIKAARVAHQPKRATFAKEIGVDDSTLQILEGARRGRVSDRMLDFVTAKLGWEPGRWRAVLGIPEPGSVELSDRPTGDELRAAREARGWSLEQLAEQLQVGPKTIAAWESGEAVPQSRAEQIRAVLTDGGQSGERPAVGGDDSALRAVSDVALLSELLRRARTREQGRAVG